jgi:extracellular factor (EF) 3-hydroxypalmitic acid methyl ester biosynthesis protein
VPRSYESLMGAIGRSVFYRPQRQRVRELLSRDARPQLLVNGNEYPLFDLSMNGVSFLSSTKAGDWPIGGQIELSLLMHDSELYSGPATIARADRGPRGWRIGVGLTTGYLDLMEIRRQDDLKRLDVQLRDGPNRLGDLVPTGYKDVVSDILHFLHFHKKTLDEHEPRYRQEMGGERGSRSLAERALESMRSPWRELQERASNAAIESLENRDVLLATKDYTETLVTPLALDSPICRRAYEKPFGYPGDYQVMMYYYNNDLEGDSAYGKVIHKFACEHPLANGVRTRRDFIAELMEAEHRRVLAVNSEATFRVVSLGCGPAFEVSDFIARNRTWPGRIIWTLIDQEEETLSIAYQASRREIGKWGSNGQLNLLNLSFAQMISEGLPLKEPGSQQLIFATGLFDYIRESRAQDIVRAMYDLLEVGGLISIGNAIAPNDFFWEPEFVMDWTMFYRTRDEMTRLAELLPQNAHVEVVTEPGGAYFFLMIRKL